MNVGSVLFESTLGSCIICICIGHVSRKEESYMELLNN